MRNGRSHKGTGKKGDGWLVASVRRTTLTIQSTAETQVSDRAGADLYIYCRGEIEKRSKETQRWETKEKITLDQDVMVEEATDILPPLDRSWRIMRFPPVLVCRYIHTYEHAYIYAYKHTYMYTDVHTCMHSTYMYTCIHKYIFACVHTYMHMQQGACFTIYHTLCIWVHTNIHIHIHKHTYHAHRTHTHKHTYMHTYI